jgi:hypothetical protein
MPTLNDYIVETRRLLHDVSGNFWTTQEITDYVNDGRTHVVQDSGCKRVIQSYTMAVGQETIAYSTLPQGNSTIDVLNINLYWGDSRFPMYYMAWTDFNAQLRFWQNYNGRPVGFSIYGVKTIYIGPKPDQTYELELDTVVLPTALVNLSDEEADISYAVHGGCRVLGRLIKPSTKSKAMASQKSSNKSTPNKSLEP